MFSLLFYNFYKLHLLNAFAFFDILKKKQFIKHKTIYNMSNDATKDNEQVMESFNDTHFYVKDDTVIVSTPASASQRENAGNDATGEYFVRNITR